MKTIRFLKQALSDIDQITDYLDEVAPDAKTAVLEDIHSSISQLKRFPLSGPQVPGRDLRKLVSTKYRFKIAYRLNGEDVWIVGVFRYQNRMV